MKRFYCTVCRKVKRVQKWPVIVASDIVSPDARKGECNYHANPALLVRTRAPKFVKAVPQVSAKVASGKRGR